MAYDPKDPDTIKAIEAIKAEMTETHEAEIAGLKAKNKELLTKIKKGIEADPVEIERLENEVESLQGKLKESDKQLKAVTKERDTHKAAFESESAASRKLLVENGLTQELVANNVSKSYLPAVMALLSSKVTIKAEGDNRIAMVGDKKLGDFVKEWSQGDEGKAFVTAPVNGGGNSSGGKASGSGANVINRAAFDAMSQSERMDFSLKGGKVEG